MHTHTHTQSRTHFIKHAVGVYFAGGSLKWVSHTLCIHNPLCLPFCCCLIFSSPREKTRAESPSPPVTSFQHKVCVGCVSKHIDFLHLRASHPHISPPLGFSSSCVHELYPPEAAAAFSFVCLRVSCDERRRTSHTTCAVLIFTPGCGQL